LEGPFDNFAIALQYFCMWIERWHEAMLARLARQFRVVLVTGPRQSGKTSLLTHVFPDAHYLSLDDPAEAARAADSPESFLQGLETPVIIDEIQYAPSLLRYLKLAVDRSSRKGRYLLTGSQSFPLMQGVSESLAGRVGVLELTTLSADEAIPAQTVGDPSTYILRGGFPVLHAGGSERPDTWYPAYVSTYLERDVRNVLKVSSLRDYARFLRIVAARTGTVLSYSDLARDTGIAPNTAKAWLSVLHASGLVFLLEPYFQNVGKRLVKSPKIYFADTGLACHLVGLRTPEDLNRSPLAGGIWETYAFGQVYRAALHAGLPVPPIWFWRTADGNEVDFILERGGRFEVFEARYAERATEADLRGIRTFERLHGAESVIRATIICRTKRTYPLGPHATVTNGIGLDVATATTSR
jgi:predicted AAA+ superfamily ATPase